MATKNGHNESVVEHHAPAHANRLAGEDSPYLLQHAHNPVDWFPWCDEALQLAKEQNKPIFLSIGYSACHWCHVMERESFADVETAKILNEHFIAIKVDREEHPELDDIYMTAVQLLNGQGGWPLNVFLTPDLKPFFGGTYFPHQQQQGMPSFKQVVHSVARLWHEQPENIETSAAKITQTLRAGMASTSFRDATPLDISLLQRAAAELKNQFDPINGGFGGPPKFPPAAAIDLLLRQYRQSGDDQLLKMATTTLDRMSNGGIHDQLGGGFHRYAVDAQWIVPHFEKMLYDNAQLAKVYLHAWQVTGQILYRHVAEDIFDYVLRDMTDPRGGFYTSQDADSDGEEGKFYTWTPAQIEAVLGTQDAETFCQYYGVTRAGNFDAANILYVSHDPDEFARSHNLSPIHLEQRLAALREKLLEARNSRIPPGRDDKVLAACNGLMISALARGYQILGGQRYLQSAQRAADFVLSEMAHDDNLLHAYRNNEPGDGKSKLPAYLDDYAEIACSLIDLYEVDFDPRWLEASDRLTRRMIADFCDKKRGGFYYTSTAHKNLLLRSKPFYDGPVPSGNSTAAVLLLRLACFLDNSEYGDLAEKLLLSAAGGMRTHPAAHLCMLCAADFHLRPTMQIAIVGPRHSKETKKLLKIIHSRFIPNKILALLDPDADSQAIEPFVSLPADKQMIADKPTVYICENRTCRQPTNNAKTLETILENV